MHVYTINWQVFSVSSPERQLPLVAAPWPLYDILRSETLNQVKAARRQAMSIRPGGLKLIAALKWK